MTKENADVLDARQLFDERQEECVAAMMMLLDNCDTDTLVDLIADYNGGEVDFAASIVSEMQRSRDNREEAVAGLSNALEALTAKNLLELKNHEEKNKNK